MNLNEMDNQKYWAEFLALYQELPCLWEVKSKDYKNRHKRNAGYEKLLIKLQEISPTATLDILKKKLTNMKTCFKRELKKVRISKITGSGPDSTYHPSLWYYDLMLFLDQGEDSKKGLMIDDSDEEFKFIKNERIDYEELAAPVNDPLMTVGTIEESNPHNLSRSISHGHNVKRPLLSNSSGLHKVQLIDVGQTNSSSFSTNEEDEFSVAGKRIAYQLKGMEEHQRLIAEKLISDIMYFGRMGKLTENGSVNIGKIPHSE